MPSSPVVFIEDDPDTLLLVPLLLGVHGYTVMPFTSCEDALPVIKGLMHNHQHPVILTDHNIKGHMSGGDMIKQLKDEYSDPPPAIILTADTVSGPKLKRELDIPWFSKPVMDWPAVENALQKAIDQAHGTQPVIEPQNKGPSR